MSTQTLANTTRTVALLLAVFSSTLSPPPASAAACSGVYCDNFDDPTISDRWFTHLDPHGPTVERREGRIVLTVPAGSSNGPLGGFGAQYASTCRLTGDFDAQVGYQLPAWPSANGVRAVLDFSPTPVRQGATIGVARISFGSAVDFPGYPREMYVTGFPSAGFSTVATSDVSGTLRTVRSGAQYTTSFAAGQSWQTIGTGVGPTHDVRIILYAHSEDAYFTDQEAVVDFDNFVLNSGTLVCDCGNGSLEPGEQCDDGDIADGDCCSSGCQFETDASPCPDDGNLCTTDRCDGAGLCSHAVGNIGTECRTSAGPCDPAEACTGTEAACPGDTLAPSTLECRAAAAECDAPEYCTGASTPCPTDAPAPSTVVCRAAVGPCDLADHCSGADATCPADALASSAVECRPVAGPCDVPETCTGTTTTCRTDTFSPSTLLCRAAAGECDLAESCSGLDASCPTDALALSSQECRAAGGACDPAERCTGDSPICPPDALASGGTACRSPLGSCDLAESCSGTDPSCPGDAKAANSTLCRASTGTCDSSEYCDGTTNSCPLDSGPPACGLSDRCCPGTCGATEDPDCCSDSITFSNCLVKPSIASDKPDKYRVSCSVMDATASTNGLHLDTDPLWLVIRDASTSPAACLEELLSPGLCIGGTCDTGTFELESCSEDPHCRPCRQTGGGFLCRGKPRTPGIARVALKLLRDGSGRRYKLVMTGATTDLQCSLASLPWSLGIVQGDDCGDVACTRLDGSRISCPGVP